MARTIRFVLLVGVGVLAWAAKAEVPETPKSRTSPAKRDPAADAFALPRTVVLSARQAEAFAKLRAEMEPLLREAMERVQQTTDSSKKLKAASEVKQIREQIRVAIAKILQNQFPETTAPGAGRTENAAPSADARRKEEERRRVEDERKRLEQQRAKFQEEQKKRMAAVKHAADEQKKKNDSDRKKWEDEKKKHDADRKRADDEQKKKKAEQDRKKREEDKKKSQPKKK